MQTVTRVERRAVEPAAMTGRRLLALTVCVLALSGTLAASAGAETAPTPTPPPSGPTPQNPATPEQPAAPAPTPPADAVLSNESTLTTWASPIDTLPIYALPETHSRRIGRTHLETEDGFAEIYLLLRSHTDAMGNEWIQLRVPGRPNGRTGWVSREALGSFHRTDWLVVIDRHARRLTAYVNGRRRFTAPVGVGKPSTPTPPGHFWIRERFRITDRSNPYYPYALGTSDYSTLSEWPGGGVVGIHGDFGAPQLIPGDPSHGCVRMHRQDIAWLAPHLPLGTPVHII
jgi:hypothetical protein